MRRPDPLPKILEFDRRIKAVWRDASEGRIDIATANKKAMSLIYERDRLADLSDFDGAPGVPRFICE